MITVKNGVPDPKVKEAVIFPFDNVSFPYSTGLKLTLIQGKTPGTANPIVLREGPDGSPDSRQVRFYGTIIPIDGELRMWYLATAKDDTAGQRICYATSKDGINWEKPNLGLVEYNGNKNNNLVEMKGKNPDPGNAETNALPVLYDPEDPDPNRRFKLGMEAGRYGNNFAVAFSPDGLRWTEYEGNPVAPPMEHTGLIKFNGCYYVNAQDEFGSHGSQHGRSRKLVTFASYDFINWTQASCLGLRRDPIEPNPTYSEWNVQEEVHLGAGLWDRGNVILGIYDIWHGTPTGDRKDITMDLGLVVTNDVLHVREPVPDFKIVPAYEEAEQDKSSGVTLSHGQGMANVGDKTFLWYELWGGGNGIRLASWERDRIGYFQIFKPDFVLCPLPEPHAITCPIETDNNKNEITVNVDGLSEHCSIIVELLDERFQPIPGYSGNDCIPLSKSGLKEKITWKNHKDTSRINGAFRMKVSFSGIRPEDAKLYALYVS